MEFPQTSPKLNDEQKKAVSHLNGPLMVVAGAGTGKTRVIVERIKSLVISGVDPNSILALTFTEKAASEMIDRLNESRGGFTLDVTVATYNGFGDQILQEYGVEIGLGSLRLLGETGQLVFIREHFDEFKLEYFAPVSKPDSQLGALTNFVSNLKQQLIEPAAYEAYASKLPTSTEEEKLEKQKQQELARFYSTYISLCRENHVIDYDDQLYLAVELLNKRPNIKKQLQERFKYILVDEFQDTNPLQSTLLDLITAQEQNLMVVGDDDQSIYGWRGATLQNILSFKTRYPKSAEVALIENYRSSQSILDAAYRLIQNNNPDRLEVKLDLNKKLHSQAGEGIPPTIMHFSTIDMELSWVAETIAEMLKNGQEASGIAILARNNQMVRKAHEYLELHDIPHAVAGLSNNLYDQISVSQLIEALKAIHDPLDDLALYHTLGGPIFNLPAGELSQITAAARRDHSSFISALENSEFEDGKQALKQLATWRESSREQSVGQLSYAIMTDSGWKQQLYERAGEEPQAALQVQALSQFFKTLKEFENISDLGSLQSYLQNLPSLRAGGQELKDASLDISDDQVNILSVHRSKGLEWDTVFIIDCAEGSFPSRNHGGGLSVPEDLKVSSEADNQQAEERRLMYVAITRARSNLYISYSDTKTGRSARKPSRFISELTGESLDTSALNDKIEQTTMELFAPNVKSDKTINLPSSMLAAEKFVLSVSQIDCLLRCPKDFYYTYVLQIPLPDDPKLVYGTLIHSAIQSIHEARRNNQPLTIEEVSDNLKQNLPKHGYQTAGSRERAHKQAIETINQIFKRFSVEEIPNEIEQSFRVEIPDTDLIMRGRIDAAYTTKKGTEIRDYKTGTSITTPEKAKQRATSSNQLTLYALAWKIIHDEMPALLTLDFVETNQQGSVKKQEKSLDTMTAKLVSIVEDLKAGNYPEGSDHTYCNHPL